MVASTSATGRVGAIFEKLGIIRNADICSASFYWNADILSAFFYGNAGILSASFYWNADILSASFLSIEFFKPMI
jgi:hypothetical protein